MLYEVFVYSLCWSLSLGQPYVWMVNVNNVMKKDMGKLGHHLTEPKHNMMWNVCMVNVIYCTCWNRYFFRSRGAQLAMLTNSMPSQTQGTHATKFSSNFTVNTLLACNATDRLFNFF